MFQNGFEAFPRGRYHQILMYESRVLKEKRKSSRLLDLSSSPKQLRDLKPCNYAMLHFVFICPREIRQFPVRKQGDEISWVPKAVLWSQDLSFYDPEVLAKDQVLARVY